MINLLPYVSPIMIIVAAAAAAINIAVAISMRTIAKFSPLAGYTGKQVLAFAPPIDGRRAKGRQPAILAHRRGRWRARHVAHRLCSRWKFANGHHWRRPFALSCTLPASRATHFCLLLLTWPHIGRRPKVTQTLTFSNQNAGASVCALGHRRWQK